MLSTTNPAAWCEAGGLATVCGSFLPHEAAKQHTGNQTVKGGNQRKQCGRLARNNAPACTASQQMRQHGRSLAALHACASSTPVRDRAAAALPFEPGGGEGGARERGAPGWPAGLPQKKHCWGALRGAPPRGPAPRGRPAPRACRRQTRGRTPAAPRRAATPRRTARPACRRPRSPAAAAGKGGRGAGVSVRRGGVGCWLVRRWMGGG